MTSISQKTLFALTALSLVGSASAGGFTQTLYGLGRKVDDFFGGTYGRYGFDKLEAKDFPSFGTFAWTEGETRFSSAFGMAYRTHRHILSREKGEEGQRHGLLNSSQPISHWDDAKGNHALLVSTVKVDQRNTPGYTSQEESWGDLLSVIQARLEGSDRSALTLAIRSKDGTRIRPIFVYKAEVKLGSRDPGAQKYWYCRFYDPSIQIPMWRDGRAQSQVLGSPDRPNDERFQTLRFPTNGAQAPQVLRNWMAEIDHNENDGAAFGTDDDGDGWVDLELSQIWQVDFHGADQWAYSKSVEVDANFYDHVISGLTTAAENAGSKGFRKHVEDDSLEFGAFDQAEDNPGAPAPTAD